MLFGWSLCLRQQGLRMTLWKPVLELILALKMVSWAVMVLEVPRGVKRWGAMDEFHVERMCF